MPNIILSPDEQKKHAEADRRRKILENPNAKQKKAIDEFHATEQEIGEETLNADQVKVHLDLSDKEFETLVQERKLPSFKDKEGNILFLQSSVDYLKTLKEIQEGEEKKAA